MQMTQAERKTVKRLRDNPIFFVDQVLGGVPWDKQIQIIKSVRDNPRTTVRSCSDSGKSWTASVVALWFLFTHCPSTVITTAPTWRQVKDILWREIQARYVVSKYPLGGEIIQTSLTINPKWFAMGISTDEAERFQGFHNENVLVIVDEASGVDELIFNAIENPLAGGHTRLLLIGNPTQVSGSFYDSHRSQIYTSIHVSAFDTPNFAYFDITIDDIRNDTWRQKIDVNRLPFPYLISPAWVAERYLEWGEASLMWECYVMGNFPMQGTDTLIPLDGIEAAQQREIQPHGTRAMGVDIARFGEDENVAIIRQGNTVLHMDTWRNADTMETAGRIAHLMNGWQVTHANIDVIGIGAGVVDRLHEQGWAVNGVSVAERSVESEICSNLRAEIFWNLRQLIVNGDIDIPEDSKITSELASLKYKFNSRGQLVIESKEDMKKRGLQSPDRADALALAFYDPIPNIGEIIFIYDALADIEPISPDLDALEWW